MEGLTFIILAVLALLVLFGIKAYLEALIELLKLERFGISLRPVMGFITAIGIFVFLAFVIGPAILLVIISAPVILLIALLMWIGPKGKPLDESEYYRGRPWRP